MTDDTIHRRSFDLRMEPVDGRTLEGCCVPYGVAAKVSDGGPGYYEVFEPGAFRRQLKAADKVVLRVEHEQSFLSRIGRAAELHDEASGLYGTFTVFESVPGDHALKLVEHGELTGLSIGFRDLRRGGPRRTAEGTIVRELCHLLDVSLTASPAYAAALITAVRSAAETRAELELPPVVDEQLERLRAVGIRV
jgi:hypothetical protein